MNKDYYETLLKKSRMKGTENQEKLWDSRAEEFNNRQKQTGNNRYPNACLELLIQKEILTDESSVLDIGCGPGKYVIPFAKKVKAVTGTDISSRMLELLENNAKDAGVENVETVKLDWAKASMEENIFQKKFDLVFSIQSPGVSEMSSIKKMMEVSCGYCMLGNFIYRRDSIQERVKKQLRISNRQDPHNNRDRIQAVFNLLWMDGYTPELNYTMSSDSFSLTKKEAVNYYGNRLSRTEGFDMDRVKEVIDQMSSNNSVTADSESIMAFLTWKV